MKRRVVVAAKEPRCGHARDDLIKHSAQGRTIDCSWLHGEADDAASELVHDDITQWLLSAYSDDGDRLFRFIVTAKRGVAVLEWEDSRVGRRGFRPADAALGLALAGDAVGAMVKPIQDGVGDGGLANPGVPVFGGQLRGDDGGTPFSTII